MKKILRIIYLVILSVLIASGAYSIVSYFVTGSQGKLIDKLYSDNMDRLEKEKENRIKINSTLKLNDELTETINDLVNKHISEVQEMKSELERYQIVTFANLEGCKSEYKLLLVDYEKCIFSHQKDEDIRLMQEEKYSNLLTVLELSENNYISCQKRVDNLKSIISVKESKSFWKAFRRYLVGAAFGAAFGFSTYALIKK